MKTQNFASFSNRHRALSGRNWLRVRQALVLVLNFALVLTSLPVIERLTPTAQAQITQRSCDPAGAADQIFQRCKIAQYGSNVEGPLETEAINALLSLHRLPASDRDRLVNWERSKVRAALYDKLVTAIQKNPSDRTALEQSYVTAVTQLVKQRRVLTATETINEYNKWMNNCPYVPPPGFEFANEACDGKLQRIAPSYLKFQAYGAARANSEFQGDLAQQAAMEQTVKQLAKLGAYAGMLATGGVLAGIGASMATLVAGTTVIPQTGAIVATYTIRSPALVRAIFPFFRFTGAGAAPAIPGLTSAAAFALPVVMLLLAVISGVFVGIAVFEEAALPDKLQAAKNKATNETPDLAQLLTTEAGAREIFAEFMQATFPEFPATGSVPAPQASDLKFRLTPGDTLTPVLQYKDWDGHNHTLRISGGWFVDQKDSEPERLTLDIDYKDWEGKLWSASRMGGEFWHAPLDTEVAQPFKSLDIKFLDANNAQLTAHIDNKVPTITAASVTRRQGPPDPAIFDFNMAQIATVNDPDEAENTLTVTVTSANPSNGVTLSEIKVGADGKVMARVQPSCAANNASFTLQVADSLYAIATATLNVAITSNDLPVLSYPSVVTVGLNNSQVISPATGPSDDGGELNVTLLNGSRALTVGEVFIAPVNPSAPKYTGTIWVAPTDASIGVQNAGPVGEYYISTSLKDACGQITSTMFTLKVDANCGPPSVGYNLTNPTCNGASDGKIKFIPSACAGTLRYSIDFKPGFSFENYHLQNSPDFSGLRAGSYHLIALDSAGNLLLDRTITISDPLPITFNTTDVSPTCNGASNGKITFNAAGGTGTLLYSIDGGQTFQPGNVFTGLKAGGYSVVVKDANNCTPLLARTVILPQPAPINFAVASVNPSCNGATNGQITVNASGSSSALIYSKDNGTSFQPSNVFSNLAAGTYQIKVKDANGCSVSAQTVTLTQPTAITVAAITVPNGTVGLSYPATTFTSSGGTGIRTLSLTGTLPQGMQFTSGVLSGTPRQTGSFSFSVTATDQNGCTASRNFTLTVNCPTSTATLAPTTLVAGKVGAVYSQTLTPSSGTAPFTFNVTGLPSGLSASATPSNVTLSGRPLQAGRFNVGVTVTDAYGCPCTTGNYTLNLGVPGDVRFSSDYDGDGKADLAIWRSATATFWISASATGSTLTKQLGVSTDIPVPGDYDGDGKTDFAVFRPSTGAWLVVFSSTGTSPTWTWGILGDVPAPGHYDGDGKTDLAIWRPANGTWMVYKSTGGTMNMQWGTMGDVPMPNDYDGDGKTDLAVWRAATATFWIFNSATNTTTSKQWGNSTDVAVPADYDGDGKADIAVWRPATGTFTIFNSSNGATVSGQWGNSSDVPVPGNYDTDSKADYAIWRSTNATWMISKSSTGGMISTQWGTTGDLPVR